MRKVVAVYSDTQIEKMFDDVEHSPYIIFAPPRSCSTMIAQVLTGNTGIQDQHVHEPCDKYAHKGFSKLSIVTSIGDKLIGSKPALIKEMTFQVGTGALFKKFVARCKKPIFLIRDPRLCIESRIRMILEGLISSKEFDGDKTMLQEAIRIKEYSGLDEILASRFPIRHTGWGALEEQIQYCVDSKIKYIVVDSTRLRAEPELATRRLCLDLGLDFEEDMLSWDGGRDTSKGFGDLSEQSLWYERVASSTRVERPTEKILDIKRFPEYFRTHIEKYISFYNKLILAYSE
jgi:hypothetical protein